MSLITPDFGLLFWMVVIFGIVFFLLWKFGFPVITGMVDKRNEKIRESIAQALDAEQRLRNFSQEQSRLLEETKAEQARILKEAAMIRGEIIAKAEEDASRKAADIMAKAATEIEAEKESALRDIRREVATLSVGVAEKILRDKLGSDGAQTAFIERLLDETQPGRK